MFRRATYTSELSLRDMKKMKPKRKRKRYRPSKKVDVAKFGEVMEKQFGGLAQTNENDRVKTHNAFSLVSVRELKDGSFKVFGRPNINFYLIIIMSLTVIILSLTVENFNVDAKPVTPSSKASLIGFAGLVGGIMVYFAVKSFKLLYEKTIEQFKLRKLE